MVGESSSEPLVLAFDGRRLKAVAAPDRAGLAVLEAVASVPGAGGHEIWVGGGDYSAGVYNPFVLLRGSATGWENAPGGRISEGLIEAIATTSASAGWAVGVQGGADSIVTVDALAMRWGRAPLEGGGRPRGADQQSRWRALAGRAQARLRLG